MSLLRSALLLLTAGIWTLAPGRALGASREPIEIVRAVGLLQDQVARGGSMAHQAQRGAMATVAEDLAGIEPERWREARNVHAGVLFVLSGGDPRVLRRILGLGILPEHDEKLVKGALAYAEGRNREAAELLVPIEARSLGRDLAGSLALVQAALVAKTDVARSISLLDDARLLSPGTLVEEAALRRQVILLVAGGEIDRLKRLTVRYLQRYGSSPYAAGFRRQLAGEFAALKDIDDAGRLASLQEMLDALGAEHRQDLYLSMAQDAILKGRLALARAAAGKVQRVAAVGSGEHVRGMVYEAAALIVTDDFENGLARLRGADRARLGVNDIELLEAALGVADQIRRPPEARALATGGADSQSSALSVRARELAHLGARVIELARSVMSKVDAILKDGTVK